MGKGRNMIIGARNHYYVRRDGLSDDFEDAFLRAVNLAVESFVLTSPTGEATPVMDVIVEGDSGEDVVAGYNTEFHVALKNNGLKVERVEGDGYCLFHAVAVGLNRRGEGMLVFEELMKVMENSRDELAAYVEGSVDEYLLRLRLDGYGDELEIKYMKDIYRSNITIWIEDSN